MISHQLNFSKSKFSKLNLVTDDTAPLELQYIYILHTLTDQPAFYEFALDAILTLTRACIGSLFFWDESRKEFILKAARGPQRERLGKVHIKLQEGILGWVCDQGHSVLVKDIQEDRRFSSLKRQGSYKSCSFISLPLIHGNKLIGVINITERDNLVPFDEEDLKSAQIFARHIAVAYENMKLKARLSKENESLHKVVNHLRQQLKDNEPMTALGKLAANLTHELNNPLDAIRRYVNLALDESLEDSLTREYLLKAKKGIRRAIHVIRNLFQFSRETARNPVRHIELHNLLNETLEVLSQDSAYEKITLNRKFQESKIYVQDRGLSLVLMNLYQNAQQAMNGQGILTVKTEVVQNAAYITVEDTGCGIPAAARDHIFEPFFSTKSQSEGMGIGLTMCREIIERSGGRISCESNEPSGARFVITLPCQNSL